MIQSSLHLCITHYTYTYTINTVFNTTPLFNHSTLLYKVVQGHLVRLEQRTLTNINDHFWTLACGNLSK